MTSELVLVIN